MSNIVTQRFIKCHHKLVKEERRVRSSRQFALSLDYLPQSLSEILKGRRDVTIELIRKAVALYKINPVFLYTGEGPMFMSEEDHKGFRVLTIVTDAKDDERILHVPVPAQAGYASETGNPTFIQELPSFSLPDYKYKTGTHRSFDVSGDSMEPTLFEGDKVVCSFLEPTFWESSIKDNYVYVVVTKADVLVKRIFNRLKENKYLELQSDNSFYEPFKVPVGDIREIWFVKSKISPFLPTSQHAQHRFHEELTDLQRIVAQQSIMINELNATIKKLLDPE